MVEGTDTWHEDFCCSSRRRHTRCYRDWSSDVCSSDLGVVVAESRPFLLLPVQGKTPTGRVDPAVAELAKAPYSPRIGHGVGDPHQPRDVLDLRDTVALLHEGELLLDPLGGHIRVTVENDLGSERGMPGHFDRAMPPLRVQDVERVVVDVAYLLPQVTEGAIPGTLHLPDWGHGTRHQNQEQPSAPRVLFEVVLGRRRRL